MIGFIYAMYSASTYFFTPRSSFPAGVRKANVAFVLKRAARDIVAYVRAEAQRVVELEERIEALGKLGDRELGSFTAVDWVLITLLGAIAPLILLYWGAP